MEEDDKGISIHAGFPNPAADRTLQGLDLHKLLIQNPASTFFMRLEGNEWEDHGIYDGDVVVIDRALAARPTDLVVITKDDTFLITKPNHIPEDSTLWGVVTAVIHQYRK